ncbi:hypothetical protein [Bacillus salipaludis]|uniref:Uncharacterized protein n=1 Tax=Bacillus salipaludis TaxID=2547811 RepID=A0AA90Z9Y8_9BACI|nr:hypothetical protein [Bacillus salipaludis]MDQ6600745.1 hypothetical protein [Bacillus salipaludis]
MDPLTHQIRIETEDGSFHRIALEDVVGVVVVD